MAESEGVSLQYDLEDFSMTDWDLTVGAEILRVFDEVAELRPKLQPGSVLDKACSDFLNSFWMNYLAQVEKQIRVNAPR